MSNQVTTTDKTELLKVAYEESLNCTVTSITAIQDGDFYEFQYTRKDGIPKRHTVRKTQALNIISDYILVNGIDIMRICLT